MAGMNWYEVFVCMRVSEHVWTGTESSKRGGYDVRGFSGYVWVCPMNPGMYLVPTVTV